MAIPFHFDKRVVAAGSDYGGRICSGCGDVITLEHVPAGLSDPMAMDEYREVLAGLIDDASETEIALAYDSHPDYLSSRFARDLVGKAGGNLIGVPVQHHHAHVAACMAEHGLRGPVIGVALDGTGFGPDGTVWGGEILVADFCGFMRAGHFRPVAMPGGEAAISNPWRMVLSYLEDAGLNPVKICEDIFNGRIDNKKLQQVAQMIKSGINSPQTSSAGRLFDVVAVMLDFVESVEPGKGPAASLEKMCGEYSRDNAYSFLLEERENAICHGEPQFDVSEMKTVELDFRPAVRDIVSAIQSGVANDEIAARFHSTVVDAVCEGCIRISRETGIRTVVCGGGVFFNRRLVDGISKKMRENGMEFFVSQEFPTGDASVCIGQAIIADRVVNRENIED